MKINFEFVDNPVELELKKTIKTFYKIWLGVMESRFEDEENGEELLTELKEAVKFESTDTGITITMNTSIFDDLDVTDFKKSMFSEGLNNLI